MKTRTAVWSAIWAVVLGCGGVAGPLSFAVNPQSLDLIVGESQSITVSVLDANDNPVRGKTVSYTSADPGIARVSAAGLVTAQAPGNTFIDLVADGVSGQVMVTVSQLALIVNVSTTNIPAGRVVRWNATPVNSRGNPLTRPVTWSSDNASIATVTTDGRVEGIAPGNANIHLTVEGMVNDSVVPVTITDSIPTMSGTWVGIVPVDAFQVLISLELTQDKEGAFTGRGDFGGISIGVPDGVNTITGSVSMSLTSRDFDPIRVNATFSSSVADRLLAIFNESGFDNVSVTLDRQ